MINKTIRREVNRMKKWEIDLWNSRNATLLGDIGEAIALHYLTSHGFFIVTRPVKLLNEKLPLSLISAHYQVKPPKIDYRHTLTEEQSNYLEDFPSWDYVAFKLIYGTGKKSSPFLIEVKTTRTVGDPHKKPKTNVVLKAKELGFIPIMLVVRLLENWKSQTEERQL